jgi:glycosyltransferase involved in cell wall biosynthesis
MILSILIPSLYERAGMLALMLRNLETQIDSLGAKEIVEICVNIDNREKTTGQKRNELVAQAKGKYIQHTDDDDRVPEYFIEELLIASKSDADCFSISGVITTNGFNEKVWHISKDMDYAAKFDHQGREYFERWPNHICPMKRSIAIQIPFPNQTIGEDFDFSKRLHEAGLIRTEFRIDRFPMYYYDFISHK